MPDDFVLNVRQIGQYPRRTTTSPADAFLVQVGGVGGAYNWINAPDLVSTALALGGVIHLAPGPSNGIAFNGALLSYSGGQLNFSEAFHAASITTGALAATAVTINGVPAATTTYVDAGDTAARNFAVAQDAVLKSYVDTQDAGVRAYVDGKINTVNVRIDGVIDTVEEETAARMARDAQLQALIDQNANDLNSAIAAAQAAFAHTVHSFNGREGDVTLTLADIIFAGGAPIQSPHFEGAPTANTPWDVLQSDNVLATTEFVQKAICHAFQDVFTNNPFVYSVNGHSGTVVLTTQDINDIYFSSPGTVPRVPIPPDNDASNRIASTSYVTDAIANQDLITQADIDAAIAALQTIYAPLNSPHLVGIPTAPTPALGTNTPQIATTAFVMQQLASAIAGVATWNGRSGIVVMDLADVTSVGGAPINNPTFTGAVDAPTPPQGDNSTLVATTEFVANALLTAGVASWNGRTGIVSMTLADVAGVGTFNNTVLTGTPVAPTAAPGNSSNQLANTSFVQTALAGSVTSFNGRTGSVLLTSNDISAAQGALLASPVFTGDPKAPSPAPGDNDTSIATTSWVQGEAAGYAKLAAQNQFTANNFFTVPSVVIGHTATVSGLPLQIHGGEGLFSWTNGPGTTAALGLSHSRGGTPGTQGALQAGDILGALNWSGSDGSTFVGGATIYAAVDGAFSATQMPAKLVFQTRSVADAQVQQRMQISAGGTVTVGVQPTTTGVSALNIVGTTGGFVGLSMEDYQNAAGSPILSLRHSRGALGAQGALQVADPLGQLLFQGSDGAGFVSGAAIFALCDVAPTSGVMPTNLSFYTNATGSIGERVRIRPSGAVQFGQSCIALSDPGVDGIIQATNFQLRQTIDTGAQSIQWRNAANDTTCPAFIDASRHLHFNNSNAAGGFTFLPNNQAGASLLVLSTGCWVKGTTTNDAAQPGYVGEYVQATSTGNPNAGTTASDMMSMALTAGDWDVWAKAAFTTTAPSMNMEMEMTTTSGGMTGNPYAYMSTVAAIAGGFTMVLPAARFSLSGPGTVYLVARAGANGQQLFNAILVARRRR